MNSLQSANSSIEPRPNQVAQIIPFPLIGNTTNPLDWVEVFRDLVGQISRERIGNNLADCVQVDAQYGGFYLECKTSKRLYITSA